MHLHTQDLISGITFANVLFQRCVRLCLRVRRVFAPAAAKEILEKCKLLCTCLAKYDRVYGFEVRGVREM